MTKAVPWCSNNLNWNPLKFLFDGISRVTIPFEWFWEHQIDQSYLAWEKHVMVIFPIQEDVPFLSVFRSKHFQCRAFFPNRVWLQWWEYSKLKSTSWMPIETVQFEKDFFSNHVSIWTICAFIRFRAIQIQMLWWRENDENGPECKHGKDPFLSERRRHPILNRIRPISVDVEPVLEYSSSSECPRQLKFMLYLWINSSKSTFESFLPKFNLDTIIQLRNSNVQMDCLRF